MNKGNSKVVYLILRRLRTLLIFLCCAAMVAYYNFNSMVTSSNHQPVKYIHVTESKPSKTIYVITPTHTRSTQHPDLLHLTHTLLQVSNIHWIVVEDAVKTTPFVAEFLNSTGLSYTHLSIATPKKDAQRWIRGRVQRNLALSWIRDHTTEGVFYFADDDNTYSVELFSEIRKVTMVGVWPTGNMMFTGISSPIVMDGEIVGFVDPYLTTRKFPLDMASLGFSIPFWISHGSPVFESSIRGGLETKLLESMNITKSDFEILANNCTKVLVWHTKTQLASHTIPEPPPEFQKSNVPSLMDTVVIDKVLPQVPKSRKPHTLYRHYNL